ncbi:E3 ubiquitin-protein ligase ATL42-like [Punica granatum]|uniref:RING-type E3 ubiquitin transferase n=2 Tax=Punica granatum TaxID=22663 RepID=A0A218XNP4_PUNGR|nr:E3 ubiquitin-protein ligase ATL42-like [Punica granatum]OWM86607.1 hypothetical protein CDL15_Pgr015642 [Punica granatum]PKI67161.1 hypothetical protein CRG98_012410 [Punica granatum]
MKKFEVLAIINAIILSIFLLLVNNVRAQESPGPPKEVLHPIRPSLTVIIGMLSVMFFLTFLVLAYAKFCHRTPAFNINQNLINSFRSNSRLSGVDRKVVESLPFFQFSSLRGSKEGLECVVCLSKFEDAEILRLLPNCNHAFHANCIDRWFERHSSCPLCRHKLDAREIPNFSYSMSLRFSQNPSNLSTEDLNSNLELYIQREEERLDSSQCATGSSFQYAEDGKKDKELLVGDSIESCREGDLRTVLHKFKHKIIVSDAVIKNRWSDVNSSDLMFLNSEMLGDLSSKRFSELRSGSFNDDGKKILADKQMSRIKEDIERKRLHETMITKLSTSQSFVTSSSYDYSSSFEESQPRIMNSAEKRSISEITNFSRFASSMKTTSNKESPFINGKEERIRRLWLPIARGTVQWLAGRERSSDDTMEDEFRRLNV